MRELMRDAAFAANISQSWTGAVGGYYGGPNAFHVWSRADWQRFAANRKLPIWVAGQDGAGEASQAVRRLHRLGVPQGVFTAVDMETRVDKTYLAAFGEVLQRAGYKVWVYGSASTVFGNPSLNGYWVADYAGIGPFMYDHLHVRATQYTPGQEFDSSTVKHWSYYSGPWWK
jgi:Rv2525c-like, glycoside hydrolase-like domain